MTYDKIPAMIVPDNSYVPILDKKFNGKYTIKEDINNPYNSIIYPRRGIYYDTSKGFTSDHNGKVTVFINDKRQKVQANIFGRGVSATASRDGQAVSRGYRHGERRIYI